MCRRLAAAVLLSLAHLVAPAQAVDAAPSGLPLIAILPLKGEGRGQFGDQADTIYQKVTSAFFKTRRFELMERAQLAAVLGEAKFQNSGMVDDASAVALGKQLGVKFVVVGSYSGDMTHTVDRGTYKDGKSYENNYYPAKVTVSLRMVNVENGRIHETFDAGGAAKDDSGTRSISNMMNDLNRKLDREVSNKFPLAGYIIVVNSEKEAMIDLGKKAGVQRDDLFVIVERGQDIVHPVTGKIIPGKKTVLTELKVLSVDDETSIVKINGAKVPMKVGQVIESKPKEAGFWEKLGDMGK